MTRRLTKSEARAYRDRWRLVNDREAEELRTESIEVKWLQINTLMAWARLPGWDDALREGEDVVRERWAKLRKAHCG